MQDALRIDPTAQLQLAHQANESTRGVLKQLKKAKTSERRADICSTVRIDPVEDLY
jgi:hypothetical protein